jgi:hypothetical protein
MDSKENREFSEDSSQKSNLLLAVGMLVVGLLIGGLVCEIHFSRKLGQAEKECMTQAAGVKKNGAVPGAPNTSKIIIPDQIFDIWGIVEKVDGNILAINAFFFGGQKRYTVKVVDSTKVAKREILENPPKPEEGKLPTSPFEETEARLSDLRKGDNVAIEAAENIKDKTEFEAKSIFIQVISQPTSPASQR